MTLFMKRVRAATNSDEERKCVDKELAKIRKYFADKGISPYDRKKCVWKLIYIAALGYDVNLGHAEALHLISSVRHSEKLAGYMAMSLLFAEELLETHSYILSSVRFDLENGNEHSQSLVLCALANFPASVFLQNFTDIVAKIAFGGSGNTFYVQKRAILCLACFVKKNPSIYQESWEENYPGLLQSRSVGVLMSACSYFLICGEKVGVKRLFPIADIIVNLLTSIVETPMVFSSDYIYYGLSCPWLQVKLLRLLHLLPPPNKESTRTAITGLLSAIISQTEVGSSVNRNNVEHAILFEAIRVAGRYGRYVSKGLAEEIQEMLFKYIRVREPNIRYLALEAVTALEPSAELLKRVNEHRNAILVSLRDKDLSICKRALNVLFSLCNKESAEGIVSDLLDYLKEADTSVRDELILKIALLAEKYGDSILWYIDVIIKILEVAGSTVSDDIWIRISQVVTGFSGGAEGNIETQRYAVNKVFNALNTAHADEPLVKLGAYVLGEYGELLDKSFARQFEVLSRHFHSCSPAGRAMLLSAFAKIAGKSKEVRKAVVEFVEGAQMHWDLDVQQRASEYVALIKSKEFESKKDELFDKVPVFPESFLYDNIILKSLREMQLKKLGEAKADGAKVQIEASIAQKSGPEKREVSEALGREAHKSRPHREKDSYDVYQTMSVPAAASSHPFHSRHPDKFAPEPTVDPAQIVALRAPKENPENWKKLIPVKAKEGNIFENDVIAVTLKGEFHKFTGKVVLKFVGKEDKVENVVVELQTPAGLEAQCSKVKYAEHPMVMVHVMLVAPSDLPPLLKVSFQSSGVQEQIRFALPVLLSKFIEPLDLPLDKFREVWNDITLNKPKSFEKLDVILKNPAPSHLAHTDVLKRIAQLLTDYFGLHVIAPADLSNFTEISAVGQVLLKNAEQKKFPTSTGAMLTPTMVPIFAQAEFFPDVSMSEFRFSIRSSDVVKVSGAVLSLFKFFVNPTS